jgi:ADP-heptose:LPS heptosyltransferase
VKSFKHSGDLGDIIYSLPTIRELGGGVLYLHADNGKTKFNMAGFNMIRPLLECQSYIHRVELFTGQLIDFDLDCFRTQQNISYQQLAASHAYVFGLPSSISDVAWITAPEPLPATKQWVVINATPRYQNPNVNWRNLIYPYLNDAVYIGTNEEYKWFTERVGFKLQHVMVKDFRDMAVIISRCKLFIGNASLPYAIAEGLKIDTIQVVDPISPSCVYERPNAKYLFYNEHD